MPRVLIQKLSVHIICAHVVKPCLLKHKVSNLKQHSNNCQNVWKHSPPAKLNLRCLFILNKLGVCSRRVKGVYVRCFYTNFELAVTLFTFISCAYIMICLSLVGTHGWIQGVVGTLGVVVSLSLWINNHLWWY